MNSHWYSPLTPLSLLERTATIMPEKTAVIDGQRCWTWGEFYTRVRKLAGALRQLGVGKGANVAFLSRNFPPLLEAHFGIPLAGGAIVAINYRLSSAEVARIVNLSGAEVMFVDAGVAELVDPAQMPKVKHFINVLDGRHRGEKPEKELPGPDYETFIGSARKEVAKYSLEDENEIIAIDYTSGTTGIPKGCMYSHRSTYLHSLAMIIENSLDAGSVYLWTLPMFHCSGWCYTWATAGVGATNVCLPSPVPSEIWKSIQENQVTHMCGASIVFTRLGQWMDEQQISEFPSEVIISCAASPPPISMVQSMERKKADVRHCYGLTEAYGAFTICEWQPEWDSLAFDERISRKMRQGVPDITAGEMRVLDTGGKDVPWDGQTIGEVVMRGNAIIRGYYNAPEEDAKNFKNGWLHTGDAGVIHPDGYVELKDRFKDIIICGGENIVGTEVENCVCQHPSVDEVVCYGKPDDNWGEIVKCLIRPKAGASVTADEIIDFCRQRIAHFKCPKEVEFGEIPRSPAGKVQKHLLRQRENAAR